MSKLITINPRLIQCSGYECTPNDKYQTHACLELIICLLSGIENNDNIPPVNMFKGELKNSYELVYPFERGYGYQDGGHHRLLAYYYGGYEMRVNLFDENDTSEGIAIPDYTRVNLEEMRIVSDFDSFLRIINEKYYKVPEELLKSRKRPERSEVLRFQAQALKKKITAGEMIEELYY
jgi:hypothetical protein